MNDSLSSAQASGSTPTSVSQCHSVSLHEKLSGGISLMVQQEVLILLLNSDHCVSM